MRTMTAEPTYRTCKRCGVEAKYETFPLNHVKNGKRYRKSTCYKCTSEIQKEKRACAKKGIKYVSQTSLGRHEKGRKEAIDPKWLVRGLPSSLVNHNTASCIDQSASLTF